MAGATISEIQYPPDRACPMHWHAHPSLGIVLEGEVTKRFTNAVVRVEKNCGYTLPAGILHCDTWGPDSRVIMIELDETHPLTLERLKACELAFARGQALRDLRFGRLGRRIALELRRADAVTGIAMDALVGEALSLAARTANGTNSSRIPAWLLEAREIARSITRHRIQIAEIAEQVGVHPAYLARRFRAEFGVTPATFARNARLEWAAGQLIHTDRTIAEIADEAGFADQSHFTRAFRKYFDYTPARYREQFQRDSARDTR